MSDLDTRPSDPSDSGGDLEQKNLGLAGSTARFFINSPLSPLLFFAMLALGALGLISSPKQEDPQISVPMFDIKVHYPGAEAEQVAALAIQPLERIMSQIQGVKHVYSASDRGGGIVTVQFEVGEEMEVSQVKVHDQLNSNLDKIPPGVTNHIVDAKGIDDVPIVTITLWSERDYNGDGIPDVDDAQLRQLALSVFQRIKEIPETGEGEVIGGRSEQVIVEVFPERLAGYGTSLDQVAGAITKANAETQTGNIEAGGMQLPVVAGSFLKSAQDINELKVGSHNGVPVYVRDVADVRQGPEDANHIVSYYTGSAANDPGLANSVPAVTIAVAKKKGSNGVHVADAIIAKIEELKGRLIPPDVEVSVTRNYGKTADDKVTSLIKKLIIATFFVFLLVWLAFLALKPALVVLFVVPVVLLFTIFVAWLMGYSIDRVSLFALIFSIGILVDDAIVVVENIYRRWLENGKTDMATAVDAVREVGNPTILATFTVIGALLPMGFVSGMMGPYMEPIPALGSVAMFISLFAAFVFTPWFAINKWFRPTLKYLEKAEKREHKQADQLEGLFRRVLIPLIRSKAKQRLFRLFLWGTFAFTCAFFYWKWVPVKMLPLDNKPEFSVVLDMPEGTALATTANQTHQIAEILRQLPEVTALQSYVGTARPFDFNGMVRHYYLRDKPWQAEVQVQLLDKHDRDRSSHEVAVDARVRIKDLLSDSGASFAVVEMPPGPPVLQSVVADVHHEDDAVRRQTARELTEIFGKAENLRDVDNYLRAPFDYWRFVVDQDKADKRMIAKEDINRNIAMAMGGFSLGDVKQRAGHEPVTITIQVPLAERSQISRLLDIPVMSGSGIAMPLRELGEFEQVQERDIIYHKDLRPVEYVVADVGGDLAAPVYGMMQVENLLAGKDGADKPYVAPDGTKLIDNTNWTGRPATNSIAGIEWAGEWTVTYETFRDMGIAFAAALVFIYILVVWEFGNFRIPALIMAPIPLTLLGIIPAHMVFFQFGWGGEFTATSMIGWIALAGIIVRNSILLVDFAVHEVKKGVPVEEAVIRSCKTRTRPIIITAFALVFGASVIFFDPIFQGMAVSLAFGVLVSTLLTLVVIPLGCINAADSLYEVAGVKPPRSETEPEGGDQSGGGRPVWLSAWSGAVTTVTFAFYAVRGIGLLIGQAIKNAKPTKSAPVETNPASPPAPVVPPGATPAVATEAKTDEVTRPVEAAPAKVDTPAPAPEPSAPSESSEPSAPTVSAEPSAPVVETIAESLPAGEAIAEQKPDTTADSKSARKAAAESAAALAPSPTPAVTPNKGNGTAKPAAAKPSARVARKKAVAKKAAVAKSKTASKKARAKPKAPAGKVKSSATPAQSRKKVTTKKAAASPPTLLGTNVAAKRSSKKSSGARRGIRLKDT